MSTPPVEPQRPRVARGPAPRSVAGGVPVAPDEVAPVVRRFLAYVVDGAVLGATYGIGTAVALATGAAENPSPLAFLPLVLAALVGVGQWCAEAITGATVGGAALGIRTVAVRTGLPAGLLAILLRNLVVAAGVLVCFVGQVVVVISGVWDREPAQRGWHDKAAGTLVVRADALRSARGGHGRRAAADVPRRSAAAARPDARAAWETAVARGVETGRPVPPAPTAPSAPLDSTAPAPAAPALAPPPPVSAADDRPTAPPPPAFVDGPPPTAVVPMVPPPASPASGLVDVPAGIAGEHREPLPGAGPVIDAVPGGPGPSAPVVARPGLVDVPATVTCAVPLVPIVRRSPAAPVPTAAPQGGESTADGLGEVEHTRLREPLTPSAQPVGLGDVEHTRLREPADAVGLGDVEETRLREPTPAAEPLPPSGLGDLEHTVLRDEVPTSDGLGDVEHTRLVGTSDGSAHGAPAGLLRLAFDTGERVVVEGDGLVGRDPSDAGVAHVVAVDDPQRSVSKVHLAFGPTGDGRLWVVDRGSTNGTVLVAPDGSGAALVPGTRAVVEAGWTIRFGQRAARVERA